MLAHPASPYDDIDLDEVHLSAAPLARVLAQVRHPALRVLSSEREGNDAALRVADRIVKQYPIFDSGRESTIVVTPDGAKEAPDNATLIWRLRSPDEVWQVSLTKNFISLETSSYSGRTDFCNRLTEVLAAYAEEVAPPSASRIGVRYTNRISQHSHVERIGQLIRLELAGPVGVQEAGNARLVHSFGQARYTSEAGGSIINWGLLPANGVFDPTLTPVEVPSWILDIDVYRSRKAPFDAPALGSLARDLATRGYTHFRWAVTDDLLRTFGGQNDYPAFVSPLASFPDDYDRSTSSPESPLTRRWATVAAAVALVALAGPTTNTDRPVAAQVREQSDSAADGTAFFVSEAAQPESTTPNIAQSVRDLHDASGLTWEQLARLFGVSRRAVHHWANGGKMAARHIEILSQLANQIGALPAANPAARRDLILGPNVGGRSLFDDLRAHFSKDRPEINGSPLTPAQLLSALHEDV